MDGVKIHPLCAAASLWMRSLTQAPSCLAGSGGGAGEEGVQGGGGS